ncbi:activating transcription factor 3 isoform X2 [Folsomia candida]|uniref:activating transcription factor 3 isoform X2 n=1 Tax=Folsomia candida TaxID=158441 RepID=UPI000B8F53E4|nr:activating transcription factor 3 isoform X2 [Folsomia candida]
MGHLVFGASGMQRLNIEAARRQAGQDLLQTPNPGLPPSAGNGTPISLSTPDILNSIIAIANPFFESATLPDDTETLSQQDFDEPQEKKVFANLETSVTSTTSSCVQTVSGSSQNNQNLTNINNAITTATPSNNYCMAGSPHSVSSTSTSESPPPSKQQNFYQVPQPSSSVESMRSKLIKDSLKLTIQTKRKNSGKEELDVKSELVTKRHKREELTPEDEERRKRRRERNKVAATKCRNKKKEKTVLLVQEAEVLETDNVTLKSEIALMEEEFKRLSSLLTSHTPNCVLNQEQKPSTSSSSQQHHHQDLTHGHQNISNNNVSSYSNSTPVHQQQQHDYNQGLNPHLAISNHHHNHNHNNNNHFMGSNNNMNMNYFGGPLHHQTIQLS